MGTLGSLKLYETVVGPMWLYSHDLIGGLTMGPGENLWDGKMLQPFFDRWSRPNGTAIDIGANYGQNALYLAPRCELVVAIEPVLTKELSLNVAVSGFTNIRPVGMAAYDRFGFMDLAPDSVQGQAVEGKPFEEIGNLGGIALQWKAAGKYMCVRVDQMLTQAIPPVCLIKSDAQGCDLRALRGCHEIIRRDRPAILFEYEQGLAELHGDTWRDYATFFADMRYTLTEQDGIGYPGNFVAIPKEKEL